MKVFALPCAGGSSLMYSLMEKELNADVVIIDYKGHGFRYKEPLDDSIAAMIEDVKETIRSHIHDEDYMIVGHSMGGIIGWHVIKEYSDEGTDLPLGLVTVGTSPLCFYPNDRVKRLSTGDGLKEYLSSNGRISETKFENKFFKEIILPASINDFMMICQYKRLTEEMIDVPIFSISADNDSICYSEEMPEWKRFTTSKIELIEIAGNHFMQDNEDAILAINAIIERMS